MSRLLVRSEAIEMSRAARCVEILQRASIRRVRRVPRRVRAAQAIVVTDHRNAVRAAVGPVIAGQVLDTRCP